MTKISNKNIKLRNFLKRKKQKNEEQIIYRTSDSLSMSNGINNSKSDTNTSNSKSNNSNTDFKSNNSNTDFKSNNSKSDNISNSMDEIIKLENNSNNKSSSINSSSFKTQSIVSKSPLLKSCKSNTDTDFNNWNIDIISSKIKKISTIDSCSETSECITDKTSTKSQKERKSKDEFTSTNSDSKFNWDFLEKKTNNTITIDKNNISITIDESNNIKIKFM